MCAIFVRVVVEVIAQLVSQDAGDDSWAGVARVHLRANGAG